MALTQESYSPHAGESYPQQVYWGDTHVHTVLSGDAFAYGTRLAPDDAYRFAKGETVRADNGEEVRLPRPLDFLMVADHAENLGVLLHLLERDPAIALTPESRRMFEVLAAIPPIAEILGVATEAEFGRLLKSLEAAKAAWQADYGIDDAFKRRVWHEVVATAERHNDPGRFTTFAGFEWSGRASFGPMIHRNVLFVDGPERTGTVIPFSRFDSDDPEDLWAYLRDYEETTGGAAIAIPHNGNLSGGAMFALTRYSGEPLTGAYAAARSRWEPIVEVTQIKGDSETHPLLSPDDEFAGFEPWYSFGADKPGAEERHLTSYARSALKLGLEQQTLLRTNPFQFGMIGSTDSHTGLATADDEDFWGKMAVTEPSPYRLASQGLYAATGYAAVWAHENTRASLFAAMRRREVYATTGPRITVRFFGGWSFAPEDAQRPDPARLGYAAGVPMGGELEPGPAGRSPSFLVAALKDPAGANLDRLQVIKGWRDAAGDLHEHIYDVALADGRRVGEAGKAEAVGNTVDVEQASYRNSIGDAELATVWTDPDFDPDEPAFYYVRVLEIPTPRWTAYDARYYGLTEIPDEIPMITRERAYTSPIWYTPK